MAITEKQLLKKKEEIESTKSELSELKGEEKALTKQLEENWECSDLPSAKKKLKKMETSIEGLNEEIEELSEAFEENYMEE